MRDRLQPPAKPNTQPPQKQVTPGYGVTARQFQQNCPSSGGYE